MSLRSGVSRKMSPHAGSPAREGVAPRARAESSTLAADQWRAVCMSADEAVQEQGLAKACERAENADVHDHEDKNTPNKPRTFSL